MTTPFQNQKDPINISKSVAGLIPPHDIEVEKVVLGSILIDVNVIDNIIIDFSEELFYTPQNQVIAHSILNLYKLNISIDLVTLAQDLIKHKNLEMAGGYAYISDLTSRVGTTQNIEVQVKILQQYFLRRKLIIASSEILGSCYKDNESDVFDIYGEALHKLESSINEVSNQKVSKIGHIHNELLKESLNVLESGESSGVPTGLVRIDKVTNGWQKSDFIIIAGRPGMGKTAITLSMIVYPAIIKKIPIGIFSLEMSKDQLVGRLQSNISGVNVSRIIKKQLTMDDINHISTSCYSLNDAPLYIDDTPGLSIVDLKGKARKLVKEHGVQMIMIDYLQLMKSGIKTSNRTEEISEISRSLKILAKELKIPVIALAQLSRTVEQRGGDKKPILSDLRESGQIEQDADLIGFCYRPDYYGLNNEEYQIENYGFDPTNLFVLIIAKHRNGSLGEIPLKFTPEQAKISNLDIDDMNNSFTFVKPNNKIPETISQIPANLAVNKKQSELNNFLNEENSNVFTSMDLDDDDDDEIFNNNSTFDDSPF